MRSSPTEPIAYVTAPARGRAFAERWRGQRPMFWCVLGHTDTCLLPGISSAGLSEELRPLTPAADAEVVLLGAPLCLPLLPSNPSGAPGPSGITRAALRWAGLEAHFVGAGLRVWPQTDCLRASDVPGRRIDHGQAVRDARELFETGLRLGRRIAGETQWLVLGESVPGGTTTALALLLALGYLADGRVSGSMPGNAHALKSITARAALSASGLRPGDGAHEPLMAVACVGDPMQPLAAGMAIGATRAGADVLLAGGSQMVAVAALVAALDGSVLDHIAIGTTSWVVRDPSADVAGLVRDVSPELPLLAVNLDFSGSRHPGLREYEAFLVKEGVGAGGACIAALLSLGETHLDRLHAEIDTAYDDLLSRLTSSDSAHRRRR